MPFCTDCNRWCETYREDASFDYAGTHCTFGVSGTHHEYGDELSECCDAPVKDYNEDSEDR